MLHRIYYREYLVDDCTFSCCSSSSDEPNEQHALSSSVANSSNDISSTSTVNLELNVQVQVASGSCNLYTRRDQISHSSSVKYSTKQPFQQQQAKFASIKIINKVEYQVLPFALPGLEVDVHYNSKSPNINPTSPLTTRGMFYCRTIIQSSSSQLLIHPTILNFLEQALEHIHLPDEQQQLIQQAPTTISASVNKTIHDDDDDDDDDNFSLNTM
jgi:hypothetical protein